MAEKKKPIEAAAPASDKKKALETAMAQIEKAYGKGSIMRLGANPNVKVESIPTGWKVSYEKARAHDDPVKLRIERIKLDAVREIQEEFLRVWGEAE